MEKKNTKEIGGYFVFGIIGIYLIYRVRYGYASIDEAFYIENVYRFVQGDKFFIDDWFSGQLWSFLMLPLMKIYVLFFNSFEGSILNFRYIFVIIQMMSSIYVFYRMKRTSTIGAFAGALSLLLYVPFGINTASYNSLGIITLAIALSIFTSATNKKRDFIFAGFFYSMTVLACPFAVFIFLIFSLIVLLGTVLKFDIKSVFHSWIWTTVGCVINASFFFTYLIVSHTSVLEMIGNVSNILEGDDIHTGRNFYDMVKDYLVSFLNIRSIYPILFFILVGCFFAAVLDKKNKYSTYLIFLTFVVAIIMICSVTVGKDGFFNLIMFPINLTVPILVVTYRNRESHLIKIFLKFWIPGMMYSFFLSCASDSRQTYYGASSASSVASIASCIIIALVITEVVKSRKNDWKRWTVIICGSCLILLQLLCETYWRHFFIFGDDSGMAFQNHEINGGPYKGLVIREDTAQWYNNLLDDIDYCKKVFNPEKVLILDQTWMYLELSDSRCSGFESYIYRMDSDTLKPYISKLQKYYDVNPNKIPTAIYLPPEVEKGKIRKLAEKYGLKRVETPGGAEYYYKK